VDLVSTVVQPVPVVGLVSTRVVAPRRRSRCSNCSEVGHNKRTCPYPGPSIGHGGTRVSL